MTSLNTPTVPGSRELDENAVYTALIEDMYVKSRIELIVVKNDTSADFDDDPDRVLEYVTGAIPGIQEETLSDFKTQNEQVHPLADNFNLSVPCKLISQQEVEEIFRTGGGWDEFYEKYPDSQGIMTLSRVGFDPGRTQALVYVGNQSHWLAGAGYYVLLTRENDTWIVQDKVMTWIS